MKQLNPIINFNDKTILGKVAATPGVYLMLDSKGRHLYIGKAKNLRRRLSSYFRRSGLNDKTKLMMSQVDNIEIRITHTEGEALLLENVLIKEMKPRYNVIFRDDKSYPYIRVTTHHLYPSVSLYRGSLKRPGTFFGPYSSVGAAREVLAQLQKIIPVRHCSDIYFRNRSRPCLQYQIKRCSAPCVGLIDADSYSEHVQQILMLLEGRNDRLILSFTKKMEQAASVLDYEMAMEYRDRISAFREIQSRQYNIFSYDREIDVITAVEGQGVVNVCILFIRNGQNSGDRHYSFQPLLGQDVKGVLTAFLPQFYLKNRAPKEIVIRPLPDDIDTLNQCLSQKTGHKVVIKSNVRGRLASALALAQNQAEQYLSHYLANKESYQYRFSSLCRDLNIKEDAQRIECYDISHTGGEAAVASRVVFSRNGPDISEYRRFNIKNAMPGDDYGALREVLTRRFQGALEGSGIIPDILFVDGGKGHLRTARDTIKKLAPSDVFLGAIAKGKGRKASHDHVFGYHNGNISIVKTTSASLSLIQHIRDEAHRFAITGHRRRRSKKRRESPLENIDGIGSKRRQSLLRHFGGIKGVESAGINELSRVSGISSDIAKRIYQHFH